MTESLRQRPGDQPLPTGGEENVQDALIAHIEKRKAIGLQRYGQPVMTFNGRNAPQDLLEELLDGATYAMQVLMEMKALKGRIGRALALHIADQAGDCVSCEQISPCETRQALVGLQDATGLEGHPVIEGLHVLADQMEFGGASTHWGARLRAALPPRTKGPEAPYLSITRTDPIEEVVCSPYAMEQVRARFGVSRPPTGASSVGLLMGIPVYVDDELPPRTVRMQPHSPKQ